MSDRELPPAAEADGEEEHAEEEHDEAEEGEEEEVDGAVEGAVGGDGGGGAGAVGAVGGGIGALGGGMLGVVAGGVALMAMAADLPGGADRLKAEMDIRARQLAQDRREVACGAYARANVVANDVHSNAHHTQSVSSVSTTVK